jgi:hypothetical protein
MFQIKLVEKIRTHTLCSVTFIWKSYRLADNMVKYCRASHAPDDNMVHYLLDTQGYKHTPRMCNTYFFLTAIIVAQVYISVMLYVHLVANATARPFTVCFQFRWCDILFYQICKIFLHFLYFILKLVSEYQYGKTNETHFCIQFIMNWIQKVHLVGFTILIYYDTWSTKH